MPNELRLGRGKPIPDGKGETIRFRLRNELARYVSAARRTSSAGPRGAGGRGQGSRAGAAAARDYDPKAVRAWVESQGIEVSSRGGYRPTCRPVSRPPTPDPAAGPGAVAAPPAARV